MKYVSFGHRLGKIREAMFYSMLSDIKSLFPKKCLFWLILAIASDGFSQSSLKEYKHKGSKPTQAYPDYDRCKKLVLEKYKQNKTGPKLTRSLLVRELEVCKEMHPASFSYKQCKKSIVEDLKVKGKSLDREEIKSRLQVCKTQLSERVFPSSNPVPVWFDAPQQAFFAGLGLNDLVPVASLRKKGFDCSNIQKSKEENIPANYWFFPFRFSKTNFSRWVPQFLNDKKLSNLAQYEKKQWDKNNPIGNQFIEHDSKKVAGLYLDQSSSKSQGILNVYYGSMPCHFAFDVGPTFKSASIFYLLNPDRSQALPYFGVVFYESESNSNQQTAQELAKRLQTILGNNYNLYSNPGKDLHLISQTPFSEYTAEGDPSNLCPQKPSTEQSEKPSTESNFLGIIKPENPELKQSKARYLMLVNMKNLCDYHGLYRNILGSKN